MPGRASSPAAALVAVGMSLVTVGLVTRGKLQEQSVFGLPGDWLSGLLFGVAIGLLLLAVAGGARTRRG